MDAKDYFKVLENLYTDPSFILGILSKEINADVVARIILAYFLTNRAEYNKAQQVTRSCGQGIPHTDSVE